MASSNAGLTYALPWLLALPGAVFGGDVVATGLAASDTLRLADELSASGRHGQAAAHYQALLDDPPTLWDGWMQAQVRLRLASSQLAQGEFATARGTLQSLQQAPAELQDAARALHSQIGEIESEAAQAQSVGLASLRAERACRARVAAWQGASVAAAAQREQGGDEAEATEQPHAER